MAAEKQNHNWSKNAPKVIKKKTGLRWIALIFLAMGFSVGYFGAEYLCSSDCFYINGDTHITVQQGTDYTYYEEGATIISFGRDLSTDVIIETDLIATENGTYPIDTSKAQTYTITYTIDDLRYHGVKKVRFITVTGG